MSETIVAIFSTKVLLRGRLHVYIQRLVEEGFLVQDKKQLFLTEQDAARLLSDATQYSDYTSGPAIALLLRHLSPLDAYSRVRGELEDVYSSQDAYCALRDRLWLFPSEGEQLQRAVLVAVQGLATDGDSLLPTVNEALKEAGFAVVHTEKAKLTQDQAKQFCSSAEQLSGLSAHESHLLVLERCGAVDHLNLLVGPEDTNCARLHAPSSLRARFGPRGLLCSASVVDAERQVGLVSSLVAGGLPIQRTVVLLLPALVSSNRFSEPLDIVARAAERAGLSLVAQSSFALSGLQAQRFGATDPACPTASIGSGPVAALVFAKSGAVDLWRSIQEGRADGPVSLHTQLSQWLAASGPSAWPLLYSSPSPAVAEKQIDLLFPHLTAASLDAALVKDTLFSKPYVGSCAHAPPSKALSDVLTEALTALCKHEPKPRGLEAVSWLSRWLLSHSAEHVTSVIAPAGSCTVTLPTEPEDGGAPVEVVVSLSHPASSQSPEAARCRDGLLELIETSAQYERLSLSQLLSRTAKGRGEHAAAVNQALSSGEPVKPAVAAALIVEEVKARGASRVLLCDAEPSLSLELAIAIERALSPPKLVLNIDSDARDEAAAASAVHYDKAAPVLSHYKQLDRVATVLCSGSAEPQLLFDQIKGRV